MHPITVQQRSHLPRAPHDTLTTTWQLEVLVPVPVAGHPLASHFRACGAGQQQAPFEEDTLNRMNETAQRVAVTSKPEGFDVVVDGKYIAGSFALNADYSEPAEGELRAAERATQTILRLTAGHQPADMGFARR